MDVDLIFRIAAVGILVAVLGQLLTRSGRDEQALMTTLAREEYEKLLRSEQEKAGWNA